MSSTVTPSFDTIIWTEVEPGIILITLNRPPMNAVTTQMLVEIHEAMARVEEDDSARVVIFTGHGKRAFSAGADMHELDGNFEKKADVRPAWFRFVNKGDMHPLEKLTKPVISALNGIAVGEGLEIAMASDFRIAARSARLGFPEANIGLIPASGGCSRIVKLVGLAKAKELVLLGELQTAEQAQAYGLLWKVVDDDDLLNEAVALAQRLLKKAPLALGLAKAVLTAAIDTDMHSAHTLEMVAQTVLMDSADHQEGVAAFLAKRRPEFHGR